MSKKPKIETKVTEELIVPSVEASAIKIEQEKISLEQKCAVKEPPKLKGFSEADFTPKAATMQFTFTKTQLNIPIGKASKQNFFMAHPDIEFLLQTIVWEKDGRQYIVTDNALGLCAEEVKTFRYFFCIYPQGAVFLFPLQVDSDDDAGSPGKIWHENDEKVVIEARDHWVKRKPDKKIKGYIVSYPEGIIPEPKWPGWTREEIFNKAFKDFIIADEDHPVIKYLKGHSQ